MVLHLETGLDSPIGSDRESGHDMECQKAQSFGLKKTLFAQNPAACTGTR